MRKMSCIVAIAAAFVLVPTAAVAAPGGRGGGGSDVSFVVEDGVYLTSTTARVSKLQPMTWIESTCYQGTSPVLYHRQEFDAAGSAELDLGETDGYKTGVGGAECNAVAKYWNLKRQKWVNIATTTWRVSDPA